MKRTSLLILALITLVGCAHDQAPVALDRNGPMPGAVNGEDTAVPAENKETPRKPESGNELDLSGQGLEKLPAYVLEETGLETLDISDNNLTGALPAEIRFLKDLKVLKAANNQMTGVPAEIGQLDQLEVLDLSNNRLTGLPYELGNLKNLKTLNLSGNDYSGLDLGIIEKALPAGVEIVK